MPLSGFISPSRSTKALLNNVFGERLLRIVASLMSTCHDHPDVDSFRRFLEDNIHLLEARSAPFAPGIGHVLRPECDQSLAMLQVVLVIAAMGGQGRYRVALANAGHVFIDGHYLPVAGAFEGVFNGDAITIRTEVNGKPLHFAFLLRGDRWERQDGSTVRVNVGGLSLLCFNLDDVSFDCLPLTQSFELSDSSKSQIFESLCGALNIISRTSPDYLGWIRPVLKNIVFVRKGGAIVSHSLPSCPGLIAVSHPIRDHQLAVQLIHESSHQYFYALEHEGNFCVDDAQEVYLSPLRQDPRPISLVLLALHASLNICDFIQRCIESGESSSYLVGELDKLMPACRNSIQLMRYAKDFSTAGKELYKALERMVAELDMFEPLQRSNQPSGEAFA